MRHELTINLEKDGLMSTIEKLIKCFNEDTEAEHVYDLNIIDLKDEDDTDEDNVLIFDNFMEASRSITLIYKALRKGYELGLKEGGVNE